MAAATYLWPDWRYLTLSHTAAQTITANGRYLDAILDQLQNGSRDDFDYRLTRRQAHESIGRPQQHPVRYEQQPEKIPRPPARRFLPCSKPAMR